MMDWKSRAKKLQTDLPALFLVLGRRETPWYAKLCAGLAVAYALSPVDLIPDFIPVLGYLDDLLILPGLAALAIRMIPADVLADCRQKAAGLWADGKPRKWYYALPILLLWAIILFFLVRAFTN